MRITSLEIQRASAPRSIFRFPSQGLALGSASGEGGKSTLVRAVTSALFGDDPSPVGVADVDAPIALHLHVLLDDGTPLAIARDLSRGTVRITDAAGIDRTNFLLGEERRMSPGTRLLALTREEFEQLSLVSLETLDSLEGDALTARLLTEGRGDPRAESAAASSAVSADETPAETLTALRERKTELDRLTETLEKKLSELRQSSTYLQELRAEVDRIGALSGAEPQDVQKLGALLELLKEISERKEQVRRDELKHKRELGERGLSSERITKLKGVFGKLESPDEKFLETYRQGDTIHRGNQALVKSESRFDETRLTEIALAREIASHNAVWPFAIAVFWVLASIVLRLFSVPAMLALAPILLALASVGLGAHFFWKAKTLRESERAELQRSLTLKKSQLAELEKEQRYAAGRLALLAEGSGVSSPRQLLELHEEWKKTRGELRADDIFEKRRAELEREAASLREKLGSFASTSPNSGGGAATVGEWEALHRDYIRYFDAVKDIEVAQTAVNRLEVELTEIESERASTRTVIETPLREAGLDPSRDLDEAIERFALREWSGENTGAGFARQEAEFGLPPEEPDLGEAAWQAGLSARAEAILRRFLPEARAVEVGRRLDISFRLEARGPRLGRSELRRAMSPASLDLIALALRLAVLETISQGGESLPLFLDDPLVRADDARYDCALQLLVEDSGPNRQVAFLTCHEVRTRWFLDQHPALRARVVAIAESSVTTQGAFVP